MFCLQMPPVVLDSMKIFIFESIKIGEGSIKLMGKKGSKDFQVCPRVRNWTKFFPSSQLFYRSKKFCDCSVKMYLFGNGDVFAVFAY